MAKRLFLDHLKMRAIKGSTVRFISGDGSIWAKTDSGWMICTAEISPAEAWAGTAHPLPEYGWTIEEMTPEDIEALR